MFSYWRYLLIRWCHIPSSTLFTPTEGAGFKPIVCGSDAVALYEDVFLIVPYRVEVEDRLRL